MSVIKKNIRSVLSLVLVFLLVLTIQFLIINTNNNKSKKIVNNSNEIININKTTDKLSIDKIKELQAYYKNSDIKGIISIEGLENFNYPIVQTSNNEYYLNHNYSKKYDKYGAIYADYRIDLDNSKKILIFGHSSIKKNVPFNELENYYEEDYYKEHKYITLETETDTYRYEIFSVYIETKDFTYMNINFDNKDDWYTHILKIKNKSLYQTDAELDKDDDVLILQTCSTNSKYRKYSKKYLLIVSRRVK